jgi:hypothetical protein
MQSNNNQHPLFTADDYDLDDLFEEDDAEGMVEDGLQFEFPLDESLGGSSAVHYWDSTHIMLTAPRFNDRLSQNWHNREADQAVRQNMVIEM